MFENDTVLRTTMDVVFWIGLADSFRCHFVRFKKSGGFDNFILAHILGSLVGALRFIPYAIILVLLSILSQR